jgi:hypothetical protein
MPHVTINPADFIVGPYVSCPKCAKETLGILSIGPYGYLRRCKTCFSPHPSKGEPDAYTMLPHLQKKIVYVDQFAISDMAKAIDSDSDPARAARVNPIFPDLFARLDVLVKSHAIACPYSELHWDESQLHRQHAQTRLMYKQLSHGLAFNDFAAIRARQLYDRAVEWAQGEAGEVVAVNRKDALRGDVDVWLPVIRIDADFEPLAEFVDEMRSERTRIQAHFAALFERRRNEKDKKFDDWYREEIGYAGPTILAGAADYAKRMKALGTGNVPLDAMYPPEQVTQLDAIQRGLTKGGIKPANLSAKAIEFLSSGALAGVPFVRIGAALHASLANQWAHGGKRSAPNEGMFYDFQMVAALLPYSDAMLIDSECAEIVKQIPAQYMPWETRIHSRRTVGSLNAYLDGVAAGLPEEIAKACEEVYGDKWKKPFINLYKATGTKQT